MSFADTWPKASTDGLSEDNGPPPEGTYEVALTDAAAFTSKAGKEIVKLELRVLSAHENGYEWTELRSFASQGAANAAKATCHRLGVDTETVSSLEELDAALKGQVGGYYEVTVKRNGEYLNTYVEHASGGEPVGPAAPSGHPDDEPTPF